MSKTAWVFPGQGSQKVGMGLDLQAIPAARAKLEQAQQILGWSVLEMVQKDEETLSRTLYNQPCLYVVEAILADLLREKGKKPDLAAGHSLGEYVALYAAEVFDFATGLKLVKCRAELMDSTGGGKMAALMKFDRQKLEDAIEQNPEVVLANDNSEQQVVISGTPTAVDDILGQVKAKRAVPLKVSGAFHSPLMATAAAQFTGVLDAVTFADAAIPVLSNTDPVGTVIGSQLKERLKRQITGSVRWREIMEQLPQEDITQVLEIGPGKVLTGLLKRTCPELELKNISTVAEVESD